MDDEYDSDHDAPDFDPFEIFYPGYFDFDDSDPDYFDHFDVYPDYDVADSDCEVAGSDCEVVDSDYEVAYSEIEKTDSEDEVCDSENDTPDSESEEFDLERIVSDTLEKDRWPIKFYDIPKPGFPIFDDPYRFAKNFVDVIMDSETSNETEINSAPEAKRPRIEQIDQDQKIGRNLLDLPQHILDKILMYLCCDEPSNRRNRNLRSLASTCTDLKRFVYQSYAPDYLELGIMCIASSGYETETSELDGETPQHEEFGVYSSFLEQVNWKIKKLRLVVTKWQEKSHCHVQPATLPVLQWFDLKELIIDFSELFDFENYGETRIDVGGFLKMPKLRSITFIPTEDLGDAQRNLHQNRYYGSWSWESLKQFVPKDESFLVNWDRFRVDLCMLNFSSSYNVTRVSVDTLAADDLHILSQLPGLTSLSCLSLNLETPSVYYDIESESPVFNKVVLLVIRNANNYKDQSYFLPKLFPHLQTYETLIRDKKDMLEIITAETTKWWNFQNLTSVSLFLWNTNFSDHLCSLKYMSCLKNLCVDVDDMKLEVNNVMKIFDRSDAVKPEFNLELLRLETRNPDHELDEVYATKLLPNVLMFETLDVCVISSYHERKLVPEVMITAVETHSRLKYFRFGNQVVRYPESNKGLESKHKWCRPRLYLS